MAQTLAHEFSGIRLRGHHVGSIERELRAMFLGNPGGGEYDYLKYFRTNEKFYSRAHAQNNDRVYARLFQEDPLVMLVESPDDICGLSERICPYASDEEGIECTNPYAGYGDKDHRKTTEATKKGDAEAISRLGFNVGDIERFSEVLRRVIDRSLIHVSLGYDIHGGIEGFRRDLGKLFHPQIVKMYRKAEAAQREFATWMGAVTIFG